MTRCALATFLLLTGCAAPPEAAEELDEDSSDLGLLGGGYVASDGSDPLVAGCLDFFPQPHCSGSGNLYDYDRCAAGSTRTLIETYARGACYSSQCCPEPRAVSIDCLGFCRTLHWQTGRCAVDEGKVCGLSKQGLIHPARCVCGMIA
jgi:hypothetical protein